MSTIVTRAGKGSPLTHDELDLNFTNLNTDKLENINSESIGDLSDVDITTTPPSTGQALAWNGSNFVPSTVDSESATKVTATVDNKTASPIAKGTPVYITGATGNTFHIAPADAGNSAKMPAAGVLAQSLDPDAEGEMIISGFINGVNTTGFTAGEEIYVAVGGGYTNTAPTGEANLIQKLGVVSVVDETNGAGLVQGAGRTNALPNLDNDQFFLGNSSNVAVATDFSTAVEAISINALSEDTSPTLSANLNAATYSIANVGNVVINGTVTGGDGFGVKFPSGIDLDGAGIINSHDGSGRRIQISGGQDVLLNSGGSYNSEFTNSSTTGNGVRATIGTPGSTTTAGRLFNGRIATTSGYADRFNVDYTGKITVNNSYSFPTADGTDGQVLTTDGLGNLTFATPTGGGASALNDLTDVNITSVSDGQYLVYDANASVWVNSTVSAGSGLANIVEDTTPQLGGNLDVNGNSITNAAGSTINLGNAAGFWPDRERGVIVSYEANYDGAARLNVNATNSKHTLTANVTGSNGRMRNNLKISHIDLNSFNFTSTGGSRGIINNFHEWMEVYNTGGTAVTLAQIKQSELQGVSVSGDNVTVGEFIGMKITPVVEQFNGINGSVGNITGLQIASSSGTMTPTGSLRSIHSLDAGALLEHAGPVKIGAYTLPNTDGTVGQTLVTNGAGEVSWSSAGGGGGAVNINDLLDVNIVTPADGEALIYDTATSKWINATAGGLPTTALNLTSVSGQTAPMIQMNINHSIDGSPLISGIIDDQIGVNNQRVFQVQKSYEDTLGQRARLVGDFTAQDTTSTSDPTTKYTLYMERPWYNSSVGAGRRRTQTLYEFGGDGFWNDNPNGTTTPSSQKMNFGMSLDYQEGAFSPYVFSSGGTAIFNLLNNAGAMTRNFVLQYDNNLTDFIAVPDSVWEATESGVYSAQYDPFWGFGVQWKITFATSISDFTGNATVTINNALPPSGIIANAFGGNMVPKYANTPSWANTGARTVTLTRPASGTTFYKWTVEYYATTLFVKDWEEFTLT